MSNYSNKFKDITGRWVWKSTLIKSLFNDFDAEITTRNLSGTISNKRTEVIVLKACKSFDKIEIIGYNEEGVEYSDRKNTYIDFIEVRVAQIGLDLETKIAYSIVVDRLKKTGIPIEEKDEIKFKYTTYNYNNNKNKNKSNSKTNSTTGTSKVKNKNNKGSEDSDFLNEHDPHGSGFYGI